jgi:hypothetical protein
MHRVGSTVEVGLDEQLRGGPTRDAVEGPTDGRQSGGDRRHRVGAHRCRDPDRQRAGRELVVRQQDEGAVEGFHELGRRSSPSSASESLGDGAASWPAEERRCDREQPPGVVGRSAGCRVLGEGRRGERQHEDRIADSARGDDSSAPVERLPVERPSRPGRRQVAGPEQLGDLLEGRRPGEDVDRSAPVGQAGVVEHRDRGADPHVDRRPLQWLAARRSRRQPFELLPVVQRGPSVDRSPPRHQPSADVRVQGGFRHPEEPCRFGRADVRRHAIRIVDGCRCVNID